MTPQVDLPLERSSADLATEWLVSRMFTAVCDEVGGLTESFAADLTLVGFFTCRK